MSGEGRRMRIDAIVEHLAALGRDVSGARSGPFGGVRLSRNQLDALFLLAHSRGDLTPGRLATALGITPGAVTQLVDGLRDRGLVDTAPHPDDGRTRLLTLSPGARDTVEAFEREVVERLAPRFDGLDEAGLDELERLLGAVREAS